MPTLSSMICKLKIVKKKKENDYNNIYNSKYSDDDEEGEGEGEDDDDDDDGDDIDDI